MSTKTEGAASSAAGSVGLLEQIMAQTRMEPTHEGYAVAEKGVAAFISEILKSRDQSQPINKVLVDSMIARLDEKISTQMDQVLHHPELQKLESAWRSLKQLVDRTDFRENIKIEILHVTKEEMLDDFESAGDITQSGMYSHVYTSGYGQFGGEPTGLVVNNYTFGPSSPDIKLLRYMSQVGAIAHAPFLAAAGAEMLGVKSYTELPNLKEIHDIFEGPRYAKWRSLRETEDSRYLGLTMPRFLLRSPYDPLENPVRTFST